MSGTAVSHALRGLRRTGNAEALLSRKFPGSRAHFTRVCSLSSPRTSPWPGTGAPGRPGRPGETGPPGPQPTQPTQPSPWARHSRDPAARGPRATAHACRPGPVLPPRSDAVSVRAAAPCKRGVRAGATAVLSTAAPPASGGLTTPSEASTDRGVCGSDRTWLPSSPRAKGTSHLPPAPELAAGGQRRKDSRARQCHRRQEASSPSSAPEAERPPFAPKTDCWPTLRPRLGSPWLGCPGEERRSGRSAAHPAPTGVRGDAG